MEDIATARGRAHTPDQVASSSNPPQTTPPPAHQNPFRPPNSSSNRPLSGLPSLSSSNTSSVECPGTPNTIHTGPKDFLVCVEGISSKTAAELHDLDVSDELTDAELVQMILDRYELTRQSTRWTVSLLAPAWIRRWYVAARFPQVWERIQAVFAPISSWISNSSLVSSISAFEIGLSAPLYILDTADFVRVSKLIIKTLP